MNNLENVIKKYKNQEWYHQGFDGSPLFMDFIAQAEVRKEQRKPLGTEAEMRICFFKNGRADWYLNMNDVNRGAKILTDLAKENPNLPEELMQKWKKDEQKFEDYFQNKFPKLNLINLTDQELKDEWKNYSDLSVNRFTSSAIIDHFALGTDEQIADMLKKELKQQNSTEKFTTIFSIATAPTHQSFINDAEIDLLKIITKQSDKTLAQHQQNYFWINNNYVTAKILTEKHFQEEKEAWEKSGKNLKEVLEKVQKTPQKNEQEKNKLYQKYSFSEHLKTMLKISDLFTKWQDERKRATYINIHIGTEFLKELANRTNYDLESLKYTNISDFSEILINQNPSNQKLQKRKECSVFIYEPKTTHITTNETVEKIKQELFSKEKAETLDDIRGLTASTGKVEGTVKILKSATEVDKIEEGDILVAVMTRPDYVPAMKKAAAIVTNEGGITSHAAIVSRELGIPCIIGTKIATEAFKDGDTVLVNANHGWVKKLKR